MKTGKFMGVEYRDVTSGEDDGIILAYEYDGMTRHASGVNKSDALKQIEKAINKLRQEIAADEARIAAEKSQPNRPIGMSEGGWYK